ncbi:MAG: Gfo/Idh/MocA family oxidoreductase [Planctomycetes bacterium]|nr:Gfo/Idh/MocA family oxidoreductase [Planctomycetota bacterium]
MSKEPVRYGVVGLGRAGWDIHVAALRGRADAKIVAIADPLEARRNEAATEFGCKTYTDITSLLKQEDIEVVTIATPSVLHGPDTKQALRAGKHVVVEKPMAMSLAEADSMIKAAKAARKKLFVHQNYRFFPECTHLKEVVDSGIIGKVFHIRCYITGFNRRNDWQTLSKNGGGVLNNTCPHFIDQILLYAGAPVKEVMGDLRQIASPGDVEDHVKAFIRFENGCTADMEISSVENIAMPMPKWVFCGSTGTLTSDGQKSTIRWYDPKQVKPLKVVDGPVLARKYGNEDKLPWHEKEVDAKGPDRGTFYGNVADVLRNKGAMFITPESVREVIRTIGMIRKGTKFSGKAKK